MLGKKRKLCEFDFEVWKMIIILRILLIHFTLDTDIFFI